MKIPKIALRICIFLAFVCIFSAGWLFNSYFNNQNDLDLEKPYSFDLFNAKELKSPSNHIDKDQIHVYDDKIVLDIPNAVWAEFTDTNSMDPVIDTEANSIEIIPESTEDIDVGDIIVYKPAEYNGLIVHRVIDINEDEQGWYATVKGDNLTRADPDKVRFEQIEGILVGIIY